MGKSVGSPQTTMIILALEAVVEVKAAEDAEQNVLVIHLLPVWATTNGGRSKGQIWV